jgi:hypothetical protein
MNNETARDIAERDQAACAGSKPSGWALRGRTWFLLGMAMIAIGGGLTIALGPWPSWSVFGVQAVVAALLIVLVDRKSAR